MFEIVYDDGRRLDGYSKSSPCEPNGSGELKKIQNIINFDFQSFTFKLEVCSRHEMLIVTKWTNQEQLSLAYHFQIK